MKTLIKILSYLGLALTIIPSILVFMEKIEMGTNKNLMAIGMLLWFVTAPFWMNKNEEKAP